MYRVTQFSTNMFLSGLFIIVSDFFQVARKGAIALMALMHTQVPCIGCSVVDPSAS